MMRSFSSYFLITVVVTLRVSVKRKRRRNQQILQRACDVPWATFVFVAAQLRSPLEND